jgi:phosphoglycolate phosphatase-like HAD superfamily hydrolase
VPDLLVLWDVDFTLISTPGVGGQLYRIAFAEMFGGELPALGRMAGRTDRAIALEVLTRAGIPEPRRQVAAFEAVLAARAPEVADLVRDRGTILPGAAEAIAALALAGMTEAGSAGSPGGTGGAGGTGGPGGTGATPGTGGPGGTGGTGGPGGAGSAGGVAAGDGGRSRLVVQSLLTGNIRALAEVKLGALGLTDHLDFAIGAYGDAHEVRSELVGPARRRATLAYGRDFSREATVLVGDTPLDIEAALLTGARAVGVATGGFSVADLVSAGAHAVLPDLTDTGHVLSAIMDGSGAIMDGPGAAAHP